MAKTSFVEWYGLNFDNTYVTIDLDVIENNFRAVQQKCGVPVMAVVKADAYGHGAVQVARMLEGKCAFFGVSSLSEALELRHASLTTPILILGHTPESGFPLVVTNNIRVTIYRYESALALSKEAQRQGVQVSVHLAVDTGMSRLGFQAEESDADICAKIAQLPGLRIEGLFSHFATADCEDLTRAKAQAKLFDDFAAMLAARGVKVPICHMDNSAGVMNFENHYGLVRSGIITYGLYPSDEVDPGLLDIQPALSWYSRVTHVKTLPAGREISYGGTYVTTKPTVVATVPVGYADGYRRSLSGKFHVLIGGRKAPILGRVCMDQMMVDVTDIPGVATGDRVVLVGSDGDETITVEQIAEAAGSFNYEFICGISRRVPRHYVQGGKTTHTVHYLLDTQ